MYGLLILAILLMAIIDLNLAKGVGKGNSNGGGGKVFEKKTHGNGHGKEKAWGQIKKKLDPKDIETIMSKCEEKPNKCKGQRPEYQEKRNAVKQKLIDQYVEKLGLSQEEAETKAEEQLAKVYSVKKTVFVGLGVSEIDPADDGTLLHSDTPLTEDEMNDLNEFYSLPDPEPGAATEEASTSEARKKRGAAVFFENSPSRRWTMPVHYWIDMSTGWSAAEVQTIKDAQATITALVPCIKFQPDTSYSDRDQIHYIKDESTPSSCYGWSYVGHITYGSPDSTTGLPIDGNPIHLSGDCTGPYGKAVIMHETIHALGAGHEMSRPDRDKYITIIGMDDPQADTSQVAIRPNTGSYGAKYNTESIMHYTQGLGGLSYASKTNSSAKFGFDNTFTLTAEDITQLKRMYCTEFNAECVDTLDLYSDDPAFPTNIGSTCSPAVTAGKCTSTEPFYPYSNTYTDIMNMVCHKSCGSCNACMDARVTCGDDAIAGKCSDSVVKSECPKSCGVCDATGTVG